MCGKPNPAENDTCQFCQARLKPLIAGASNDSSAETPDWLDGLRDEEGNAFDFGESGGTAEETDDWLARLGEAVGAEPPAASGGDEPDWLRDLSEAEPTGAAGQTDLGASDFFTQGEEGSAQAPGTFQENWFTDSSSQAEPEQSGEEPSFSWFSDQTGQDNQGTEQGDWFSQQAEAPLPDNGQLDWFAESSAQEPEPQDSEFTPLSFFDEQPGTTGSDLFAAEGSEQPAQEESAGFDWDSGDSAAGELDFFASESPKEAAEPTGELPEWLNWDATEEAPAPPPAETPDWLKSGTPAAEAEGTMPVVSPFSSLDEDTEPMSDLDLESDWSAEGLGKTATLPPSAEQPESEEPDWLSSLISGDAGVPVPAVEAEQDTGQAAPGVPAFSGWEEEAEQPDWLKADLGAEVETPPSGGVPAFSFDDLSAPSQEPGAEPLEAAPDWISQFTAEDTSTAPTFPQGEELPAAVGGLERANLPGWLEAMRPVDATALEEFKDTSEDQLEAVGPLAGLRGALPVGLGNSKATVAPVGGLKAQVSEETQARVNLLMEMISAETQPRKAAASQEFMTGALIRLVLFVVLMLAAIWALWYGEQPGTQYLHSSPLPQAAAAFQQAISMLPESPRVLVAVEAEVAFSGEMDAAAEGVITYLAARRAQITFISTNPSGPLLAERYMQQLDLQPARGAVPYTNYTNLGFLPGGPAGLVAFMNAPERTTMLDLKGQPAWKTDTGLGEFAAVIVLTASSETARLWIEQAGPLLQSSGVPLLFSVSAQVTPVIQPYFDANPRQVDGILAGLPDTYRFAKMNALEMLAGEPSTAQQLVDAYSAVVLAAVLVLLIGIVVNLISYLSPAQAKERKA